jgi:uncharacterized membrane protein
MMYGYWGLGMWGGAALMILFWIGIILLALWGFRRLFPDQRLPPPAPSRSALEIAQSRYSRGEISRDEYLALINDLTQETTK